MSLCAVAAVDKALYKYVQPLGQSCAVSAFGRIAALQRELLAVQETKMATASACYVVSAICKLQVQVAGWLYII